MPTVINWINEIEVAVSFDTVVIDEYFLHHWTGIGELVKSKVV